MPSVEQQVVLENVAANFVIASRDAGRWSMAASLTKSVIEQNVFRELTEKTDDLNTLRLMVLTSNISNETFLEKGKLLKNRIEELKNLFPR